MVLILFLYVRMQCNVRCLGVENKLVSAVRLLMCELRSVGLNLLSSLQRQRFSGSYGKRVFVRCNVSTRRDR